MDSVEIVWRIPATLVMQNGRWLNRCYWNYYPGRKKLVPHNGQIDKSLMASCINSKMVVIGATYLETYPLICLLAL